MVCHSLMVYGAQNLNRKGPEDRWSFLEVVIWTCSEEAVGKQEWGLGLWEQGA